MSRTNNFDVLCVADGQIQRLDSLNWYSVSAVPELQILQNLILRTKFFISRFVFKERNQLKRTISITSATEVEQKEEHV